MIKRLRWRLTCTFVGLSALVCVALALFGMAFLYAELTAGMDRQLRVLASEFGHAIDLRDSVPYFRDWKRVVQTDPPKSLATIQLFTAQRVLLHSCGPKATPDLVTGNEAQFGATTTRVLSTPLIRRGQTVGYLQLQLSTHDRNEALREFALIFIELAPLLLLGLGVTSYFVSGKAVRPLEENMDKMRDFLADAGHELNTPLAIILARAETLERKLVRQEIDVSDVTVISRSAERTTRLANDFMLLAEVAGAAAPRGSSQILLDSLVHQVVQDFSDRFEQKGIGLKIARMDSASLWASSDDLYRAIANLLENALRYTESGGQVTVELSCADGLASLAVEDSGAGIPAESLPLIFDRFYRVDKSRSRASGGCGLGLAIVKAIVDAHGGSISASSKIDEGSRFTATLPLRAAKKTTAAVDARTEVASARVGS